MSAQCQKRTHAPRQMIGSKHARSGDSETGHIDDPILVITPAHIEPSKHLPKRMLQRKSGIVWIAAYPRSGNTWTRLFICNLAALLAGEREEENFNNFLRASPWDAEVKHYQKYIKLNPAGGENAIRDMLSVRHLVLRDFAGTKKGLVFAKTHWLLDEVFGHNTFNFSAKPPGRSIA